MQEIIQRYHGTRYITTMELSCAFLHVPLDEASRKYTDFELQSKIYRTNEFPTVITVLWLVLSVRCKQCWQNGPAVTS